MIRRTLWLALLAGLLTPSVSYAELRRYIDTQPYQKEAEGMRELEFRTDLRDPERGDSYFFHETGFEYGVSDRYIVGLAGRLVEGVGFTAARLVNRFLLSNPNEWPLDTAIQFEIQDANDRKDFDLMQGTVILSEDVDQFNFSANGGLQLIREFDASGDDEWEVEPVVSLGASFNPGGPVIPGVELFIADDQSRLVPGAYVTLAPNIRLNVGLGFGIDSDADDLQFKTLLEVEL